MRTHHLNCGSHCPLGGRLFDGTSRGLFADLCTHCLLIELADQLVLVDTGYGLADVRGTRPRRLARLWPAILNPRLGEKDTALRQIEALGHSPRDVRHVVLTHLDFDHAGGLSDLPEARVHTLSAEREAAARLPRGFIGNQRYRPQMWDHVSDWRCYRPEGEAWFGFRAVRDLDGLQPDVLMVPLAGHTAGHAGVAVATGDGWLLNAGDAYLHCGQLTEAPFMPPGLAVYQRLMMAEPDAARTNLSRLRLLRQTASEGLRIFCSHDSSELRALQGSA